MKYRTTHIPRFVRENRELWGAWARIQGRGGGEASGRGWAITSHKDGDNTIMRLEVTFEPIKRAND